MKLFLAPHNDDETLFGAFTLLREKPLVVIVTDSWVQWNRGSGVTADQRWDETCKAMAILGCSTFRLGLRDDEVTLKRMLNTFRRFVGFETIYAPAQEGGHQHHDMVYHAAMATFSPEALRFYPTYGPAQSYTNKGIFEVRPTIEEQVLKAKALACYPSQVRSAHHFKAVEGKSEWLS